MPDTSFTIPGTRFKVSLTCNGRTYKYTSLAINTFKKNDGKIAPEDVDVQDFYRIFNKILVDQRSPYQLHSMMLSHSAADDDIHHFALIALKDTQAVVFMRQPCLSYMLVSMDSYNYTLTSARVDSAIKEWKSIGVFSHLSGPQISKAIDNAEADDRYTIDRLPANFPGVVYYIDSAFTNQRSPYVVLLSRLALITHGAFNPTNITQTKIKDGIKLQYLLNGRLHFYTFKATQGWFDEKMTAFINHLGRENDLPGSFYHLSSEFGVIYLTAQQHNYAVKNKLLDK